jgi:hypothetical protein
MIWGQKNGYDGYETPTDSSNYILRHVALQTESDKMSIIVVQLRKNALNDPEMLDLTSVADIEGGVGGRLLTNIAHNSIAIPDMMNDTRLTFLISWNVVS